MRKRPSAWLYLLAILLPIGGCVGSISMAANGMGGLSAKLAAMPRAQVPGDSEVTLARGPALLWYETRTAESGESYEISRGSDKAPPPLTCRLHAPDGQEVRLEVPGSHSEYTIDGHKTVAIYAAHLEASGAYHLSCAYSDGVHGGADDHVVFFTGSVLRLIAKVFAPALLGTVAGITLALVVFFARRRADA